MTYAIISDIHANPDALRCVLEDARRQGAEKTISLGDIVGYGPLPSAAIAIIRDFTDISLAGNHDDAVAGRSDAADFIDLAGDAVRRHRDTLAKADLAYLYALPYTATIEGACCAHGDFTNPPAFNYIDSDETAKANFAQVKEQILFVGHTHVPELKIVGESGRIHTLPPQDFIAEEGKRYIVNVGSVGYPRESNGRCMSSYVLYETETRTVHFRFLPFAVASLIQRGSSRAPLTRWLLPGIAIFASLFIGLAAFFALKPTMDAKAPVASSPSAILETHEVPPLAEKVLYLTKSQHFVHANLRLLRKSPSAHLTIDFVDASGNSLAPLAIVVPNSSQKAFPVPTGTIKAIFRVRATKTGAIPKIRSFAPSAN